MMELRDYQQASLDAVAEAFELRGCRAAVQMPTGAGKTVCFAHLPLRMHNLPGKMLVLAHRHELLDQAAEKIGHANPDLMIQVEQAERKAGRLADVVVASVQSLYQPSRLDRFNADDFDKIVVDEMHHAAKGRVTYERVLDRFYAPGKLLTGWTATVRRSDNVGLERFFDDIVYQYRLDHAIRDRWLVPLHPYAVQTGTDISGVKKVGGDFVESQLAQAVNVDDRNVKAVKAYREYGQNRPCLVFCVNVAHSYEMAQAFRDAGYDAHTVVGETPREERDAIMSGFRRGEIPVLTNCMVATEGFDAPACACILMARPTQSSIVFTQMVGRCTRPVVLLTDGDPRKRGELIANSHKPYAIILDLVDNAGRHDLMTVPTLFGLSANFDAQGQDVIEDADRMREFQEELPGLDFTCVRSREEMEVLVKRARIEAKRIDLFRQEQSAVPRGMADSPFLWLKGPSGYFLSLADSKRISICENMLGHWDVMMSAYDRNAYRGVSNRIEKADRLEQARGIAERYIRDNERESIRLISRNASWRKSTDPATDKQVALLKKLGVDIPPQGLSKPEASDMISVRLAARR